MGEVAKDVLGTHALEQYTSNLGGIIHVISMSRFFPHLLKHVREDFPSRDPEIAATTALLCELINRSNLKEGWIDRTATRLLVTTGADLFLTYLVDVIGDLYWSRPALIPRNDLANDLQSLDGERRRERIAEVALTEIEDMTWKRFGDLIKKVRTGLAVELDLDKATEARANEAIEYRHLLVHHGSRVSYRFLRQTGRTDLSVGQHLPLSFVAAQSMADSLLEVAVRVDQGLVRKYGIEVFGPRSGKDPESMIDPARIEDVLDRLGKRGYSPGT